MLEEKEDRVICAQETYAVTGEQLMDLNHMMNVLKKTLVSWEVDLKGAMQLIAGKPEAMVQFVAKVGLVAQEMGRVVNGVQMEKFRGVAYDLAQKKTGGQQG